MTAIITIMESLENKDNSVKRCGQFVLAVSA